MFAKSAFCVLLALLSSPLFADTLRVDGPWARATAPGQPAGAAFMELTSETDMALVAAHSPASKTVELHTMSMDNGVMIMRQVERIDLPKGKTVSLRPGGLHIMLIGLNGPLAPGQETQLTLVVRDKSGKAREIPVTVPIRAMAGSGHRHHAH